MGAWGHGAMGAWGYGGKVDPRGCHMDVRHVLWGWGGRGRGGGGTRGKTASVFSLKLDRTWKLNNRFVFSHEVIKSVSLSLSLMDINIFEKKINQ